MLRRGLVVSILILIPVPAEATYSIVAVDTSTSQVGGAGASCVGSFVSIYSIYGSVPGRGAVHAQALLSSRGRDRAVELMTMGASPADIVAAITDPSFDSQYDRRQYGIVDLGPSAAGFTGENTFDFADDVQGTIGTYTYSAQGNILTSRAVLDQASAAFEAEGCDLADRLMRALEAGADGGQGDSRCTPDGIPADGAFIQVDRPDELRGSFLSLRVDDTAPEDPIALLRAQYDAWRLDHPCPAPPDAGTDAGPAADAGSGEDAGITVDSGATGARDGGARARGDRGGCDCRAAAEDDGRQRGAHVVLLLAAALLALRRR